MMPFTFHASVHRPLRAPIEGTCSLEDATLSLPGNVVLRAEELLGAECVPLHADSSRVLIERADGHIVDVRPSDRAIARGLTRWIDERTGNRALRFRAWPTSPRGLLPIILAVGGVAGLFDVVRQEVPSLDALGPLLLPLVIVLAYLAFVRVAMRTVRISERGVEVERMGLFRFADVDAVHTDRQGVTVVLHSGKRVTIALATETARALALGRLIRSAPERERQI